MRPPISPLPHPGPPRGAFPFSPSCAPPSAHGTGASRQPMSFLRDAHFLLTPSPATRPPAGGCAFRRASARSWTPRIFRRALEAKTKPIGFGAWGGASCPHDRFLISTVEARHSHRLPHRLSLIISALAFTSSTAFGSPTSRAEDPPWSSRAIPSVRFLLLKGAGQVVLGCRWRTGGPAREKRGWCHLPPPPRTGLHRRRRL